MEEEKGEKEWRAVVGDGRLRREGGEGLCTMHLAAAILTESDKSGENGWLWPVNIEMGRGGGGEGKTLPPSVVYRRVSKVAAESEPIVSRALPVPSIAYVPCWGREEG